MMTRRSRKLNAHQSCSVLLSSRMAYSRGVMHAKRLLGVLNTSNEYPPLTNFSKTPSTVSLGINSRTPTSVTDFFTSLKSVREPNL